jgi:S1-C subfamily serine protease
MDISTIRRSIVAVRASVPEDAFTANALGTLREGSGIVISPKGLVVTIGYLITEADEVWLTRYDGKVIAGHALAYDQETGFGLIQALAPLELPALDIGSSTAAELGEEVAVIDGAGEYGKCHIVAKQEFAGYWEYLLEEAIFTAPAHPSWGGAALVGKDGRLLGIGSLRLQMSKGNEVADINMIVPIDLLTPILDDLVTRGQVNKPPRPWLGAFSAESSNGVVVMNVTPGSPGLKQGDVIAEIRDGDVEGLADFYRKVWKSGPAGAEIPMRVLRDGRDAWLRVKTADRQSFLKKPMMQ